MNCNCKDDCFLVKELEKEIAELKKSCDETQELLDKQIEATYKLDKENAKAKELLNMFLRLHYNPIVDEHNLFCKVEQFLNSEVEK